MNLHVMTGGLLMRKSVPILLILMLLLTILPAYTVAQESSSIRVALLIDSGGALNTSRSYVTLSNSMGLQLTAKGGAGTFVHYNSDLPIRVSLNQYRILIAETSDYAYADSLIQRLNENGQSAYLLTNHRKNTTFYQVITGDEPSFELAKSKMQQIKTELGIAQEVIGPHALSAGTYQLEEDAHKQVQTILDAGFDASIGYIVDANGVSSFMVVVGNEGTEAELTSLWQEVSLTLPNLSLAPIANSRYLTQQQGLFYNGGSLQKLDHYYTPVTEGVWIKPIAGDVIPSITLVDRENRKYRGEFEILSYRGKLAVVNQLPLEEYLYSVVGTEMASGWPLEALKAQAVIARTYALGKGDRYSIAAVSDTTYDQAYYGIQREAEDVRQAVRETAGMVLTYQGKLIEALYSSNAGGTTAVGTEVWGNDVPYLKSVTSPDHVANANLLNWYHVLRENGQSGYIRSDLVNATTQKTVVGFDIVEVANDNTNFRSDPSTFKPSIDKLLLGEKLVVLSTVPENSAYSWIEGPIDGVTLMNLFNTRATNAGNVPHTRPIDTLKVESRGPSGRVLSLSANGLPVQLSSPDAYRTVLGGLRSTMFEIEESGRFTILGAGGKTAEFPQMNEPLTILGAGNVSARSTSDTSSYVLYGKEQEVRVVTTYPSFRFHGKGYGHGFGLSQWGARGLAEQGYDYQQILKHYYSELVSLQKIE